MKPTEVGHVNVSDICVNAEDVKPSAAVNVLPPPLFHTCPLLTERFQFVADPSFTQHLITNVWLVYPVVGTVTYISKLLPVAANVNCCTVFSVYPQALTIVETLLV